MFTISDILELVKYAIYGILLFIALIMSPFAIAGIYDAFASDLGPCWTDCPDSGFTPDCH